VGEGGRGGSMQKTLIKNVKLNSLRYDRLKTFRDRRVTRASRLELLNKPCIETC